MKIKIKKIFNFLLENWFRVLILIILFWLAVSFSSIADGIDVFISTGEVDVDLCNEAESRFGKLIPGSEISYPTFCK